MKDMGRLLWLFLGIALGGGAIGYIASRPSKVLAGSNDRFEDYILCTGTVATGRNQTDGVWMLDYRAGKLLGTIIDRGQGKIVGWAEVDLVSEFGLTPRANVHFLMTTGQVSQTQAALYVAETSSGKFGVYTMGARTDGQPGVTIKRHDLVMFRQSKN